MKIKKISLKNVKSFKENTEMEFNDDFNILIGPNGSGKSNLLDILTICVRQFFLKPYSINENNDNQGFFKQITTQQAYGNIRQMLEKFYGDSSTSKIQIDFLVKKEDIENIKVLASKTDELNNILSNYRNAQNYKNHIAQIKQWDFTIFSEDEQLSYMITDYNISHNQDNKHKTFLEYLNYFELLLILIKDLPIIKLHTNYLYFSPYRGANLQNLQANLSSQNFYQVLQSLVNATSKTMFSLISLSTIYFAEKRRNFEDKANSRGYQEQWDNDEEVKLVTKYLKKLGYDWNLKLVNINKNIYEIILTKEGKEFYINQASSGEKEIINFLLGVFAFNINNGIIIIDEPELHLHPKWQNVLLNLFTELSKLTKNQFILSTHSPIFITDKSYNHIFRIFKDDYNISRCNILKEIDGLNQKDILHIVNSTNNEKIFFADVVILVEGITDRLIFQKILDEQLAIINTTRIVEIIEIEGKSNIDNFKSFLSKLGIPSFFISDLDYINEVGKETIKSLFVVNEKKIENDVIKNSKSKDGDSLIEVIDKSIQQNDCSAINDIFEYIKSFRRKLKTELTEIEKETLREFIEAQKNDNNYILEKGDIEDYFPDGYKRKDLNNVLSLLLEETFNSWKSSEEYEKLNSIINDILLKSNVKST